jgi:hypothetical protein
VSADTDPPLVKVPSLPFVGSMLTAYSGMPEHKQSTVLKFWPEMKRQYGNFYSMGMPGLGDGLNGTFYVIHSPSEMAKVCMVNS